MLGLGHGLLVVARSGYATARAGARLVGLQAEADGLVSRSLERGWQPWMDSVTVGGGRLLAESLPSGDSASIRLRRVASEVWLVDVVSVSPQAGRGSSRRLVWSLDPGVRVSDLPAPVLVGRNATVILRGTIDGAVGPSTGMVDTPDLGLLSFADALAGALPIGGAGTPAPVEVAGVCDRGAAWNWGDPDGLLRPCSDYLAMRGANGSLAVDGGVGQGLLLVDGDLSLEGGARIHGLVIATGRLRLSGGAVLTGMAIGLGGVEIESGSRVVASRAWAVRALSAARTEGWALQPLHPALRLGPG